MKSALLIVFVLLNVAFSGFNIDIYVPSLPAMARFFNVDHSLIQLTIATYILGFSVTQFIVGGIIDTVGRRKPFLISTIMYIIATFIITITHNIYLLLFLRFIQGVTLGAGQTACRSIFPDIYSGKTMYRMVSYMTIAWAIGPIVAPGIGGHLQQYTGHWQTNFSFLMWFAIICYIGFWAFIPETLPKKMSLQPSALIKNYKLILSNYDFWIAIVMLSCLYGSMLLFNLIAPFLIETVMHYSAIEVGYLGLLMGIAWLFGNLLNNLFIKVNSKSKIKVALTVMLLSSSVMLLCRLKWSNIPIIAIPTFVILTCCSLIIPSYIAKNMERFAGNTATANSLLSGITTLLAAIVTVSLSVFLTANSSLPLSTGLMGLTLTAIAVYWIQLRYRKL